MSPNGQARQVEVSPGDFGLGEKVRKVTDCMRVDKDVLKAAPSYSSAGISADSKLGGAKAAKNRTAGGYLSIEEYAKLFDKYYAKDSIMDKMLAKDKIFKEQHLADCLSKHRRWD
eukprot:gene5554-4190_t